MEAERQAYPDTEIELWCEDEARLGLIPIIRRIWAPRGSKPVAVGRRRYQWMYVYGFVRPTTGDVYWLLLPTVSAEAFQIALDHFAQAFGVNEKKRVLMVVDNAGWHVANNLRIPDGMRFINLPAYSPELQPAERLWPLMNESRANRPIETLSELEEILVQRCNYLSGASEVIRNRTHFHWWPDDKQ